MSEEKKVKCDECGMLAARAGEAHLEVPPDWRATGDRPEHLKLKGANRVPVCHLERFPLEAEYDTPSPPDPSGRCERYRQVISSPRPCG